MSTDIATVDDEAGTGLITLPVTGEEIDLSKPGDVVRAGHALKEMGSQIRAAKSRVDEAARVHMRAGALRILSVGRYEAKEGTGKATYDAQKIYDAAIELEIPQDAVEKMLPLERRVHDGRELNALANRDDRWRKALAAGMERGDGPVTYDIQKGAAPAPPTPDSVKEQAATNRAAAARARRLGI